MTPTIARLTTDDLRRALHAGWADFAAAPLFGMAFASVYVLCGLALSALGAGTFAWTLILALGFPLIAPFAAIGLYDISRRRACGDPLTWPAILGVIWAERGQQLPWMGAILGFIFLFWSFFAHMSFALFLGTLTFDASLPLWELARTPGGLAMLGFQTLAGGITAFVTFALTAISLPLLLDRQVDFVTAMLTSLRVIRQNPRVMLLWAALIGTGLALAMLPMFLGLFLALPLFGHATWHLYRAALP